MSRVLTPATWHVEVKRYFVDTDELTKSGKPKKRPVTIRKLYVVDSEPIGDSGYYRITMISRKGRVTYSLSALPLTHHRYWDNPSGKPEPWSTVGDQYERTKDRPFDAAELLQWLRPRVGAGEAGTVLEALQTEPVQSRSE